MLSPLAAHTCPAGPGVLRAPSGCSLVGEPGRPAPSHYAAERHGTMVKTLAVSPRENDRPR